MGYDPPGKTKQPDRAYEFKKKKEKEPPPAASPRQRIDKLLSQLSDLQDKGDHLQFLLRGAACTMHYEFALIESGADKRTNEPSGVHQPVEHVAMWAAEIEKDANRLSISAREHYRHRHNGV